MHFILLKMVFPGLVYNRHLYSEQLLDHSRTTVPESIFKPHLLQQVIDEAMVGGLNYGAIEELRKIERRRNRRCCLPGTTQIKKTARELESHAMTIIPWTSAIVAVESNVRRWWFIKHTSFLSQLHCYVGNSGYTSCLRQQVCSLHN